MKILFIHHGNILGGAPLSLLYLARELERLPNIELEIVCHAPQTRDFFAKNLKSPVNLWGDPLMFFGKILIGWSYLNSSQSYKLFFSAMFHMPISIWKQFRLIRQRQPDIVHLNSAVLFSSAIAARLAGFPVVWHIREPLQGGLYRQYIIGKIIRTLASAVIAISEVEARRLGENQHGKVKVIYNPINIEKLQIDLYDPIVEKQKLGLTEFNKLIVSLGGVNPRKGTLELVDAMQYTDAQTRLLIAGPPLLPNYVNGSYEEKVRNIIANLPPNKVLFVGNLEDIVPLLAACDVLVFAGTKPHFPRPVFEAWFMKKPVVVFKMDGISNQVEHGQDGIVVNEINGEALGKALTELLETPALMRKFGEAGKVKAERFCNPTSSAKQVRNVYDEILNNKSSRN